MESPASNESEKDVYLIDDISGCLESLAIPIVNDADDTYFPSINVCHAVFVFFVFCVICLHGFLCEFCHAV